MRVTVAGGTGFIGTHLVQRLVDDGHEVTAIVRSPALIPSLRLKGVTAVTSDVEDAASLDSAMSGSEIVFNLARAKAHGTRPRDVFAVNVDGARNVARAAARSGARRLIHCSSSAVYGSRVGIVREDSPLRTDSAYARSKLMGEQAVSEECGSRAVIARITAVLGPGGRSWLPLFRSAGAGKLRLVGDGTNKHHPADVSDIVEGLMLCAFADGAGGRVYNLAGPEPLTIGDLRDALANATLEPGANRTRHPRPYPRSILDLYYHAGRFSDRALGLRPPLFESVSFLTADRVLDLTRARNELGFVPAIDVSTACRRTAEWLRQESLL